MHCRNMTAVLVASLFWSGAALAQDTAVQDGARFLATRQNGDGSWGAGGEQLIDTVEAAITLADDPNALSKAVDFLATYEGEGTDALARKLAAIRLSPKDTAAIRQALLSHQNGDSSWGARKGHRGTPLDTALAIRALSASDIGAVAAAIPYLAAQRLPSGGWPLQEGGDEDVYVTANVVFALGEFALRTGIVSPELQENLVQGSAFLATSQGPDGSFGTQDKTLTTAWCVLALLRTTQPESLAQADAFLRGTQRSDGSWEGETHPTALAVRALRGLAQPPVEPPADLRVDTISFDPASPSAGVPVLVTIDISNTGSRAASDVGIIVEDGTVALGPLPAIPVLAPRATAKVAVTAVFSPGTHSVRATADPSNLVIERNRANNVLAVALEVAAGTLPDLAIAPEDLSFSSSMPLAGEVFTIAAVVRNPAAADASNVTVSFFDGDPAAGGKPLGNDVILARVPASGSASASLSLSLQPGSHSVFAVADRRGLIAEANETNNATSKPLTVLAAAGPLPDLAATELTLSVGEAVTISARITNIGAPFSAPPVSVRFLADGVHLGDDFVLTSLQPGASADLSLTAALAPGTRQVSVVVDPTNGLAETLEANNTLERLLDVNDGPLPNLVIESVETSKTALDNREPVTLSARVKNTGFVAATAFAVRFSDGSPVGGARIGTDFAVAALPAGGETLVQVTWTPSTGPHRVVALADATNRVAETNEGDNMLAGPSLTVSAIPYSDPQVFEETGKDFWAVVPNVPGEQAALYVLADEPASFSITGAFTHDGTVTPGAAAVVFVPTAAMVSPLQQVVPGKGIHVTSTSPVRLIQVFARIWSGQIQGVQEATLVPPWRNLGTDHRIAGFVALPFGSSGTNAILVLGTEDATNVSIQVVGTAVPQTFNVALGAGDAWQFRAYADLSGSRVTSTKPVVSVSYTIDSFGPSIPDNDPSWTPILEYMPPSKLYGTRFIATVPAPYGNSSHFRIVAHEDQTQVTITQSGKAAESVNLAAGQSKLVFTDRATDLISDKPVLAVQYPIRGDAPAMSLLLPTVAAKSHFRIHALIARGFGTYAASSHTTFLSPFGDAQILLNGQRATFANAYESMRDNVKFSYDAVGEDYYLRRTSPLEAAIDATRPILVSPVAQSYGGDTFAYTAGYRFRIGPDFFPASISVPDTEIFTGRPATVRVRIHNVSLVDAPATRVRIFDGDPAAGGQAIGPDLFTPALPREEETELSISWTPRIPGARSLTVVVDPMNEIAETDEDNNSFSRPTSVSAAMDVHGTLALGGTTFMGNQELAIDTRVENVSTSAELGTLRDGRLEILVEDVAGNVVARLPMASMPELGAVPPGLDGWRAFVEATLAPERSLPNPSIVAVPVDFTRLLRAAGIEGMYDGNSLRVVEIAGTSFRERPAYLIPGTAYDASSHAKGMVEWRIPGPLVAGAPRRFRIYFDALQFDPKPAVPRLEEPAFVANTTSFGIPSPTTFPTGAYILHDRKGGFSTRTVLDSTNLTFVKFRSLDISALDDFTGDGFYDPITEDPQAFYSILSGAVYVAPSQGSNSLGQERPLIWSRTRDYVDGGFRSFDVNGDGMADLIQSDKSIGSRLNLELGVFEDWRKASVYLGQRDGTFRLHQTFFTVGPFETSTGNDYYNELDIADIDGDAIGDIIVPDTNNAIDTIDERHHVKVFRGQGDGTFATVPIETHWPPDFNRVKFTAGDFTNDGKIDLLFHAGVGDTRTWISLGNGDGTFLPPQIVPNGTSNMGMFFGGFSQFHNFDYNRDGKLDVITTNIVTQVRIAFGNGAGDFTSRAEINPNIGQMQALAFPKTNQVSATLADIPRLTGAFLKDFSFNTDALLPGAYRVRMNVLDGTGKLVFTTTQGFDVVSPLDTGTPDEITEARIVADKAVYGANETVKLTSTALNVSTNATLTGLTLKVSITSPESAELFSTEKSLDSLLPGANFSFESTFETGILPPGTPYTARLEILKDAARIAIDEAVFSIGPTFKFAGTVALTPASILKDQPFSIDFTLRNLGNMDIPTGTARFSFVQTPIGGAPPVVFTKEVAVAPGASVSGTLPDLASTDLGPGTYVVAFELLSDTHTFPIAVTSLTVREAVYPFAMYAIVGDHGVVLSGDARAEGNVFSNHMIWVLGSAQIQGDAGTAGTKCSIQVMGRKAKITGKAETGLPPILLPSPEGLVAAAEEDNANDGIGKTAKGKDPLKGTCFDLNAKDSITLSAGTYYFTSFKVNGTLNVDGLVTICVSGPLCIHDGAKINPTQGAGSLLLVSDSCKSISIGGRAEFVGAVYAPLSPILLAGDSTLKGFVVGHEIVVTGQARTIYDPASQAVSSIIQEAPLPPPEEPCHRCHKRRHHSCGDRKGGQR